MEKCPFCNSNVEIRKKATKNRYFAYCTKCKARGPMSANSDIAVSRWNFGVGTNV